MLEIEANFVSDHAQRCLTLMAHATLATGLVVGLYLLKSAAGINLMAGPSPLHDLFYHFVR